MEGVETQIIQQAGLTESTGPGEKYLVTIPVSAILWDQAITDKQITPVALKLMISAVVSEITESGHRAFVKDSLHLSFLEPENCEEYEFTAGVVDWEFRLA